MEGATAIAIFVRCFADKNGIEQELERRLYVKFPREVLATISVSWETYILSASRYHRFGCECHGFHIMVM